MEKWHIVLIAIVILLLIAVLYLTKNAGITAMTAANLT